MTSDIQPINSGDIQDWIENSTRSPKDHKYFMRMDSGTVVKSESEYTKAQSQGVQMKIISYSYAIQLLKEEDAKHNQKIKKRQKQKAARKVRKVNRK